MKRRWVRILAILGTLAAVCLAYAWFFGFQTMMLMETRRIARRAPIVKETPHPLQDTSLSPAPGARLSYFGYEFEIPWDDLDPVQTKLYSNHVTFHFRSGRYLMFSSTPPRSFIDEVSKEMGRQESLRATFGDAALQSDYAMWSTILAATPDKVSLFSPPRDIVANSMLVLIKGVSLPEKSGIFSLETKTFRGFQWGDPEKKAGHVVAGLFNDDGRLEFVFSGTNKNNPAAVSQAEINRVLQSVHKNQAKLTESPAKAAVVTAAK